MRRRGASWLALLLGLLAVGVVGWPTTAVAAPHATPASRPPVVLFAVPGLLWADVEHMPHLRDLAATSSVAEMSVKTRSSVTRCGTALIAVSAGNRTSGPLPPCALDMSTWPLLQSLNSGGRFNAKIGALGTTLQAAGIKTVAVGQLAVPMLANDAGKVSTIVQSVKQAAQPGSVVAILDQRLFAVPDHDRATAAVAVDARLANIEASLPTDATFVVAGISDISSGASALHAVVIHGPGWSHVELRSSAAGRAPYVQLIDLAPTILAAMDVPIPSYMVGRPIQQSHKSVPSISSFVDDNRHAVLQRTLGHHVFLTLGIVAIVMMVFAASPFLLARRAARWLAWLVAPAPPMIFIANAFPWWRGSQVTYGVIVIAGCVVAALVVWPLRRRSRTAALVAIPVFSFITLAADQFTGANLQLSAPLGDSPIVAGRFSGMGNLDFTVFATSALLIAGLVGARLTTRSRSIAFAGLVVLVAIVIDGAPSIGNDIGGVLAMVPASLILLAMVSGIPLTKTRVIGALVVTGIVAVGVALADYSRPATSQTHVGRFVGQVLHGGAGTEVHRKLDAAMATFGWTIGTFVLCFSIALAPVAWRRMREGLAAVPGGIATAVAATVVGVLGAALNDSGVVIAAMASILATSAFVGAGPLTPTAPAATEAAMPQPAG